MKVITKKWLGGAAIGLLLGGVTVLTPGCAGTVGYGSDYYGGGYTPGYYGGGYAYDYYPGLNVYYYPQGGYYNWYDGGRWVRGRHLPPRYTVGNAHHERREYRTQEPWNEQHGYHH